MAVKKLNGRTVMKWLSVGLMAAGLTVGIIGLLLGGLQQADFLFWKQWIGLP